MNIIDLLNEQDKKHVKFVHLTKDQMLFQEDEECRYVGVVIMGTINISSFSFSGKEMVFNVVKEGDIFGNNLIFSKNPFYRGNVIATTNAIVGLIDKKTMMRFLQNNENFLLAFLQIESEFSKSLNSKIKLLSFDSAEERFFYYLFSHNNEIKYQSITNLALELGMQRETLSRLLSKLEKNGKILKNNHSIRAIVSK